MNPLTNDPNKPAASDQQGLDPVYGQQAVHHHHNTDCLAPQHPTHNLELDPLPPQDPLPHLDPLARVPGRSPSSKLGGQRVGVVDDVEVVQGGEVVQEVVRSCSKPERGIKRKHKLQDESENLIDQNCTQLKMKTADPTVQKAGVSSSELTFKNQPTPNLTQPNQNKKK